MDPEHYIAKMTNLLSNSDHYSNIPLDPLGEQPNRLSTLRPKICKLPEDDAKKLREDAEKPAQNPGEDYQLGEECCPEDWNIKNHRHYTEAIHTEEETDSNDKGRGLLRVPKAAKAKGRITWSGSNLFFAQDYAKSTTDKRKKFLDMRLALKSLNAHYGLFHPCLFKVTYNNKTTTYEEPALLQKFIDSCRGEKMDISKVTET
ncbi:hypothetical protein NDU88_000701 [Pleurodeles waltl]|uniref:Uncharacterized protein n=1 Tax=Pleurodeles waltl TaxID=8319 RepID=A0AAV7S5D4_PLEWA|nr:hypothetical protein NDU88_000701 [Pleurodeles waltl]